MNHAKKEILTVWMPLILIILAILFSFSSCHPFQYSYKDMAVVIMRSDTGIVECKHKDSYRVIYPDNNGQWHREWFHEWQVEFIND